MPAHDARLEGIDRAGLRQPARALDLPRLLGRRADRGRRERPMRTPSGRALPQCSGDSDELPDHDDAARPRAQRVARGRPREGRHLDAGARRRSPRRPGGGPARHAHPARPARGVPQRRRHWSRRYRHRAACRPRQPEHPCRRSSASSRILGWGNVIRSDEDSHPGVDTRPGSTRARTGTSIILRVTAARSRSSATSSRAAPCP